MAQKSMIIKGCKVLITNTGSIFINGIRINDLIIIGDKYHKKTLFLKNKFIGNGKVRQVRDVRRVEYKKFKGLTIEEVLTKLNLLQDN